MSCPVDMTLAVRLAGAPLKCVMRKTWRPSASARNVLGHQRWACTANTCLPQKERWPESGGADGDWARFGRGRRRRRRSGGGASEPPGQLQDTFACHGSSPLWRGGRNWNGPPLGRPAHMPYVEAADLPKVRIQPPPRHFRNPRSPSSVTNRARDPRRRRTQPCDSNDSSTDAPS